MAFIHGRNTVVTLDSDDLSAYTKQSEISRKIDKHDVTAYGADGHAYNTGLQDATITLSGTYDSTASTGPRAVILPLWEAGAAVTFVRQPEGAGSSQPQDSASVVVESYVETNPVADMVTWSATLQVTGVVDSTAQSA